MSYTRHAFYPCSPGTERGRSTKLAAANVKGSDKIIYANGRSVIVSLVSYLGPLNNFTYLTHVSRSSISRCVSNTACVCLDSDSGSFNQRCRGW